MDPYDEALIDDMLKLSKEYGLEGNDRVSPQNVADMMEYAKDIHNEALESLTSRQATWLFLVKAQLTVLVYTAMAFIENQGKKGFIASDWAGPDKTPDPNFIFGLSLLQLANYCYAVISLIEKGLDTPARALFRSVIELADVVSIISADKEAFQIYVIPSDDKKHKWYGLFSSKKMTKRIAKIERVLGIPEWLVLEMRTWRKDRQEYFSEAVHPSYVSVTVGVLATVPGTDRVEPAMLGGPNVASDVTLSHLIVLLQYSLTMFFASIRKLHDAQPRLETSHLYKKARAIFESITPHVFPGTGETEQDMGQV